MAASSWLDALSILRRIWGILKYPILGKVDLTAINILAALLILILAFFLSRRMGHILERRIAKRVYIDPGLRYTIARLATYVLIVIGVLSALKVVGVDLTSVAVIFTALSVGIGFGLQYLAADIASGFILLFERPVRVGDRITIGDDEGDVQNIKLRTTILYTNDRIAIIVPNSKLVTQRVINWSYGDPRARISIPIGVATTSDVNLVTKTLLAAAENVDHVLTDPPPKVQFLRFGEYSLDFRLLVWTRNPSRHPQIKSDINYRIEKLFRQHEIEIPFPVQKFMLTTTDADNLRDELAKVSEPDSDESLPK
jgi:small-conductance mechanosensitive channel